MPIISQHEMALPSENKNTTSGQKYTKRLAYVGFALDDRVLDNSALEQIYNDTVNYNTDSGYIVKIKTGHMQEGSPFVPGEQKLAGFVTNIQLRKEIFNKDRERLELWGDFHLYDDVAADFSQGRYPERSIGLFSDKVTDSQGNDIELALDHVAILGAERAALPENQGEMFSFIQKLYNFFGKNKLNKEEKTLEVNQNLLNEGFDNMTNMIKTMKSMVNSQFSANPVEEPPKEPIIAPTDADKPKSTANEVLKEFNLLHKDGKVAHDEQSKFFSLAENSSLDYAKSFYSDREVVTPPTGKETGSDRDEKTLSDDIKAIIDVNKKMGLTISTEEANKIAEEGA